MESKSYPIPSWNYDAVHQIVDKLNRKSVKHQLPLLRVVIDREYTIDNPKVSPNQKKELIALKLPIPQIKMLDITLDGDPYKLNGWTFLGTLDHHTMESSVLVHTVPGQQVPQKYFTAAPVCDHCNKVRYRTETFVVRHEDGREKQVGRNCLQEFFGIDPHALVQQLTRIFKLLTSLGSGDERFYGGRPLEIYSLDDVLAWSHSAISKSGWVSRKQSQDSSKQATADFLLYLLRGPGSLSRDSRERQAWQRDYDKHLPDDANKATVPEIKNYFLNPALQVSEYVHNIRALIKEEIVPERAMGYAASMAAVYLRHVNELKRPVSLTARSEYVGELGHKVEIVVTVAHIMLFNGHYGLAKLHSLRDEEGRTLIWFATGADELEVGGKYRILGTVKKHEEYKGWKQTTLTRVKALEALSA